MSSASNSTETSSLHSNRLNSPSPSLKSSKTNEHETQSLRSIESQSTKGDDDTHTHTQTERRRLWSFWKRETNNPVNPNPEPVRTASPIRTSNQLEIVGRAISISNQFLSPLANTYISHTASLSEPIIQTAKQQRQDLGPEGELSKKTDETPNIVVPSFDVLPVKGAWNTMTRFISSQRSRVCPHRQQHQQQQQCLYRVDPMPRLRKITNNFKKPIRVLLIGVHGFFPTKMLRAFIGDPTGTSLKFISEAEEIVRRYFNEKQVPYEIDRISLEKEGEILDRVGFFFNVMKDFTAEIQEADFIYFVSHSQGCPVTIILLARLIEAGIIKVGGAGNEDTKQNGDKIISVLGMAGINNGPYYGADQTLIVRAYTKIAKDSMMELFEFQKFDSIQSKELMQSLRIIFSKGIKLTLVASINDQLVPLYSSLCMFTHHPNIFRATFIDRDSRTPAFITRIMKLAGNLLDLGYSDHNVIKEISSSLVGPLTCGGHSSIYNEKQVYELGLRFSLETSNTSGDIPVDYTPYQPSDLGSNPYHLPWCMRGLLVETKIRLDPEEINLLCSEYDDWTPDSKKLKDIKYRLNGLKFKI